MGALDEWYSHDLCQLVNWFCYCWKNPAILLMLWVVMYASVSVWDREALWFQPLKQTFYLAVNTDCPHQWWRKFPGVSNSRWQVGNQTYPQNSNGVLSWRLKSFLRSQNSEANPKTAGCSCTCRNYQCTWNKWGNCMRYKVCKFRQQKVFF